MFIDKIYIINLKKNIYNFKKSLYQLKSENLLNYKFIEAVDGNNHKSLYESVTEKMDKNFVKHNFSYGALGCLLSHIKVIKDAKINNYKQILILEDDFIFTEMFSNKFNDIFKNLNAEYDLIYLGKKQGHYNNYEKIKEIHNDVNFEKIKLTSNKNLYIPNYQTWGTHALLIKNTLFDEIINFEKNIIAPIDIMLMSLYNKYKIYSIKNDLIISDDLNSDIQVKKIDWNWDFNLFPNIKKIIEIKKIFIVGSNYHHTHNYIHKMYLKFFNYYYPNLIINMIDSYNDIYDKYENCLIISSPVHFKNKLLINDKNYYIIHLDTESFDNLSDKNIDLYIEENLKSFNNYFILLCREKLKNLKYFEQQDKLITLPWFSNYLFEEINFFNKNIDKIYDNISNNIYYLYMGSIWDCNIDIIKKLINVITELNLKLIIKGRIFNVSIEDKNYIINNENVIFIRFIYDETFDFKNNIEYLLANYKIKSILSIQGQYHNDNYITNRVFESISLGYLILSNNLITKQYYNSILYNENLKELIINYENILQNKNLYIETYKKQYNEFLSKFYGYNNIKSLINLFNNNLIFDTLTEKNYNINFTNIENLNYYNVFSNECIRKCLKKYRNINIVNHLTFDSFLIERLISNINYTVYCQKNYKYLIDLEKKCKLLNKKINFVLDSKLLISKNNYENEYMTKIININQKLKDNKSYYIDLDFYLENKNNYYFFNQFYETYYDGSIKSIIDLKFNWIKKEELEIFCLISGKRTGSTFIIDYLQKTMENHQILPLSEIFNLDNTYFESYDVNKGILKKDINKFKKNTGNYDEYFNQFIKYAESKLNINKFLFKYTIDFLYDYDKFMDEFIHIEKILKKCKIIYLNRNEIESYVSLKFAMNFGFSHTKYDYINDEYFLKNELIQFCENKHAFECLLLEYIKFDYYLDYYLLNTNMDKFLINLSNILNIKNLNFNIDFLPKQNELNIKEINFLK